MNPVHRLHNHLIQLNKWNDQDVFYEPQKDKNNEGEITFLYQLWGAHFLSQKKSLQPKQIWFLVDAMSSLLNQCEKCIIAKARQSNSRIDPKELLFWMDDVNKSVHLSMDDFVSNIVTARGNSKIIKSKYIEFKEGTLTALRIFAALLGDEFNENDFEANDKSTLIKLLENVENECAKESDEDLKEFIREETSEIKKDIHAYNVQGGKAFKKTVERIAGKILANADLLRKSKDKPVMKAFHSLILFIIELAKKCSVKFFETIASSAGDILIEYIKSKISLPSGLA
jgi:hypothetical protein